MKYPELCERLLNEQGEANVLCSSYPGMGATDTSHAKWFILVQDGAFDVGGMDRGEWISTRKFSTEEGACDYVYALMTRKPELHTPPTPAELERSRLANEKMMRQLRGDRGPTPS